MPNVTTLHASATFTKGHHRLILGKANDIIKSDKLANLLHIPENLWMFVLKQLRKSNETQIILEQRKVVFQLLPSKHSRHNSPSNIEAIQRTCNKICRSDNWDILILGQKDHLEGQICATAKAFPSFSAKTTNNAPQQINILPFVNGELQTSPNFQILLDNIRLCGSLVDQPPNHCHVSDFIQQIQSWIDKQDHVHCSIIQGEQLHEKGLNGIWNVGKAAEEAPAMVCLQFRPQNNDESSKHVCWVGKGIIYDTGGLSIKSKTGMPGMKTDMGGAAAVYTAFKTAIEQGWEHPLSAILCLAENAIGSRSVRPDDIITMYSGKTVEINNTDAEGRLVLADGVAWAEQRLHADIIIDMATLTGAASTSVGKGVAAVYCNDESLENIAIEYGRKTGELCHPLPYIPEKWKLEFQSSVADMKNSVARRNNAQSACAGQFIGNHLSQRKPWLHLDIAGAAYSNGRATSFGMHLLVTITNILQNQH